MSGNNVIERTVQYFINHKCVYRFIYILELPRCYIVLSLILCLINYYLCTAVIIYFWFRFVNLS